MGVRQLVGEPEFPMWRTARSVCHFWWQVATDAVHTHVVETSVRGPG